MAIRSELLSYYHGTHRGRARLGTALIEAVNGTMGTALDSTGDAYDVAREATGMGRGELRDWVNDPSHVTVPGAPNEN